MAKNRLSIPVAAVVRERNVVTSKPERTLRFDARAAGAWRTRCAAALLTCWAASGAHAGGPISGSVSGSWSTPVLSGNLVDGATGALTPTNNSSTAQCNLGSPGGCMSFLPGDPATTLAWGNGASAPPVTSTLSFIGLPFEMEPSNTQFPLGTFTYTNGASDTDSLIFGATLTLTLTDQSGLVIDTQIVPLVITTTSNDGTSAQNADFVQFPKTSTTFSLVSMNVFEGSTATFTLEGQILGDPTLELTQLLIAPDSESSGFVGNGRPVPEPGTFVLLGAGFAAAALLRRARRSSCRAAVLPVS
jgi:hypothetical protein